VSEVAEREPDGKESAAQCATSRRLSSDSAATAAKCPSASW
jgi:hypothetical protein